MATFGSQDIFPVSVLDGAPSGSYRFEVTPGGDRSSVPSTDPDSANTGADVNVKSGGPVDEATAANAPQGDITRVDPKDTNSFTNINDPSGDFTGTGTDRQAVSQGVPADGTNPGGDALEDSDGDSDTSGDTSKTGVFVEDGSSSSDGGTPTQASTNALIGLNKPEFVGVVFVRNNSGGGTEAFNPFV